MADLDETLRILDEAERLNREWSRLLGPPPSRAQRAAEAFVDVAAECPEEMRAIAAALACLRDRERRSRGGKVRAEKLQVEAEWMRPLFVQAYAALQARGLRRIGHERLLKEAYRIAGRDHPRRDEMKESHARAFLKAVRYAS